VPYRSGNWWPSCSGSLYQPDVGIGACNGNQIHRRRLLCSLDQSPINIIIDACDWRMTA
jgi:hypothetical protein